MKHPKAIALTVLIVLVSIVVLQNTAEVETSVLWMTVTMPRILLLLLVAGTGFLGGYFVARWRLSNRD